MNASQKSNSTKMKSLRSRPLLARAIRSLVRFRNCRVETLEGRVLLSGYALTTIQGFGANGVGSSPNSSLVIDRGGNLYGTTTQGGAYGLGTVFEVVASTGDVKTLASFDASTGGHPNSFLALDTSGNLYGTTQSGGGAKFGTVFELLKDSGAIRTLATFDGANGAYPYAGVTLDADGNLYGTTFGAGPYDENGSVFELAKGTSTIQTLARFNGSNGMAPCFGGVVLDSERNIFGTTQSGGTGYGTVFEIPKATGALRTLITFPPGEGVPFAGVTMDSGGNLFGTTSRGGSTDRGTVFEIPKATGMLQTIASFDATNGGWPDAGVTIDARGNLYGTTSGGGAHGLGTVFEIPKGTATIQTLVTFDQANGAFPNPGVTVDLAGNLYGTTSSGGLGDHGTVFKLSPAPTEVVVNSVQDLRFPAGSGIVSLRNAVAIANANSTPTTISFDPVVFAGKKTITLNGQDFELSDKSAPVTIAGPGADRLTINANARSRIFQVDAGVTANISGLTLTNGNVYSNPTKDWDASGGGAIRNDGTLNLSNTFVNANHGGQAGGGGLYNKGVANVINCTISNNHVDTPQFAIGGDGGGIENDGPTLNLNNVTLAKNSVTDSSYGGGINFGERNVTTNLANCTIVNNVASATFDGGGGLALPFNAAGTVTLSNTIIANNSLIGSAQFPAVDVLYATSRPWNGVLISKGHNLIGIADGSSAWIATDRTGTLANPLNPKLSPLGNNGGPMPTIVPLAGSPAIDAGGNALIPAGITTDQRGLPRISGSAVDIGATEVQQPVVTGFVLVDADTNKDIMPITEGMTLDLAKLPRRLSIRAVASSNIASVQLVFDGQSRLEQQAPWSVFGDWNGDYIFGNLAAGSHTLTARAFTGRVGTGIAGPLTTLHFKAINQAPAPASAVTAIVLYNTATGQDIRILRNYDTLDLSLLPATLGIRVRTSGTVGSVQYVIDGRIGAPASNALVVGEHQLTAIPYSGANATGTPGASLELHLFIRRS